MNIVEKMDGVILKFFTFISHKFQRLTGRTNFFLAKFGVALTFMCVLIHIFNYYKQVLSVKSSLFGVIVDFVFVFYLTKALVALEEEDRRCQQSGEVKTKDRFLLALFFTSSLGRLLWSTLGILDLLRFYYTEFGPQVVLSMEIVNNLYCISIAVTSYFIAVEPLPPGKSKVREFLDSFVSGFKKFATGETGS